MEFSPHRLGVPAGDGGGKVGDEMTLFALFVDCTIGALLWVLIIYVIAGYVG
jgi:hypothetical protein